VIIYDLRCKNNHTFEGWFQDRTAFEKQKDGNFITCPVCGDVEVSIVPSSRAFVGKESRPETRDSREITPAQAFRMFHEFLNKNFDDVGNRFAEVALKIHHGDEEKRNIKGTTTPQEEDTLREEGIEFLKIPVPKLDS
jgi:hypothetical protein